MGLSSSMWTSVSGLLAHGEKMSVVSNNISNVNTVGFKGSRLDFASCMGQYMGTTAGLAQVGRGTSLGILMHDFSQGSMEATTSATDIAISGNGFFCVKPQNSNSAFYTRAGNFTFNAEGYLVNPNGYNLQGWRIDNTGASMSSSTGATSTTGTGYVGTGTPVDIRLDTFSCAPKHTNSLNLALNLDSATSNDKCTDDDNPFFALLNTWDATPTSDGVITPLGSQNYAFAYSIEVFDEGGQAHTITIYFDRVTQNDDTNIDGMKNSDIIWEYIVTMDPSEDQRVFADGDVPDQYKGLLMSGTLSFSSSGTITDMTAYVPTTADMGNMGTWVQSPLSKNGYPVICPNFTGRDNASNPWNATGTGLNPDADGYLIELNLGIRSTTSTWSGNAPATIADWVSYTGNNKVMKAPTGMGEGSVLTGVGQSSSQQGVVGADGLVYTHLMGASTAGQVADGSGYLYVQKALSDGLSAYEVADSAGWVYEQAQGSAAPFTGFYEFLGSDGNTYYLDSATNTYYESTDTTLTTPIQLDDFASMIPPVTIAAVADTSRPVATTKGIPSTTAILQYQADGVTPVPETETRPYSGMGTKFEMQSTATTSYTNNTGNNFYERSAYQDGYTYGEFRSVNVDQNGILSATYSNGVTLELYQITLYDFPSTQNLRHEGSNMYSETLTSGIGVSGAAGTGGFGTTESYQLEMSNVDLSTQLVYMITTQRGFQANSKSITTVDTMLDTVINMKR